MTRTADVAVDLLHREHNKIFNHWSDKINRIANTYSHDAGNKQAELINAIAGGEDFSYDVLSNDPLDNAKDLTALVDDNKEHM